MQDSTQFLIGVWWVIISCFICINPYFLIFGLPLYVIGAIILLSSKEPTNKKLNWTFVPFGILILFYFLGVYLLK